MLKKNLLLIFLLLAAIGSAYSQYNELLSDIVKKNIKGQSYSADLEILVSQTTTLSQFSSIELFFENDNSDTRYLIYNIIYRIGKQTKDTAIRDRAVYVIISRGLNDVEPSIRSRNLELLEEFNESDFTPQSRSLLASIVMNSKTNTNELIHLAGKIKLTELVSIFEQRLTTSKSTKEVWLLHCALARMGDVAQKEYCLNRVKRMGINDQVIQSVIPDLLFIQDKNSIDYLLNSILIDNMNCSSFNPDSSEKLNCAFRLIEQVAPYIIDFPVKVGASGDLEVANYQQALTEVRQWIAENSSTYQVNF